MVLEIAEYAKPLERAHVEEVKRWYLYNPKRWVQGLSGNTEYMCLGAALTVVIYGKKPHQLWEQNPPAINEFAIRGQLFGSTKAMERIVEYNDSEDVAFSDVIALLDKVIASFDEETQSASATEI